MLRPKGLRGIVFAMALVLLALPAFPKEKAAESQWTATPVVIDGLAEEWGQATFLTEEGAGADVAFRNDADYLYMVLLIKDKAHLSSFDLTGIFIYFSGEGKKNKDRRLHFYKQVVSAQELIQAMERSGQTLTDERKAELLSRPNYILYQGEWIKGVEVVPVEISASSPFLPPLFKSHTEEEKTVVEFRLPLSKETQAWGLGVSPGGMLKIGLTWGGLTEKMKAERLAQMMAASQRGDQPNPPSTEDTPRAQQAQTNISREVKKAPPKEYSFWLDVKLAKAERP